MMAIDIDIIIIITKLFDRYGHYYNYHHHHHYNIYHRHRQSDSDRFLIMAMILISSIHQTPSYPCFIWLVDCFIDSFLFEDRGA